MGLISKAREFLSGDYLGIEKKFAPSDPTVNWQYINHLVYTANTVPYAQDSWDSNSAVFACLLALARASIEAPLRVVRRTDDDEFEPLPDHPLQDFIDNPHPDLEMVELRYWSSWARHIDGNAYLVKRRSGNILTGNPVELWPVSPLRMSPHTERGSGNFIDSYRYDADDGNGEQFIPKENVLHFKLGVDPRDPRKGLSGLKAILREIATDAEATRFSQALLANFGIPGLVIKLPIDTILGDEQIRNLKDGTKREFGGTERGKVGVLTGGADMAQFGFSPEQMNLKALHDFPETRIAAVMGVDPLVARLGVGLEQTSNYASSRQVRENFTELTVVPIWTMDDQKWTRKLARDFTSDRRIGIQHDLSRVRALQEDENDKHARYNGDFQGGVISREEARAALGYDPEMKPGDVIYVPTKAQYVEVGKELTDPEEERQREADASAARLDANLNRPATPAVAKSLLDDYGSVVQAIVDRASVDFADDLERLQASQGRRVKRALANGTNGTITP